jgi:hypothetical protein
MSTESGFDVRRRSVRLPRIVVAEAPLRPAAGGCAIGIIVGHHPAVCSDHTDRGA